ncbi:MAG: serine hydrolase [Cytophagales bacterium]|nr:MAG: serine hydrolase [Cytophagales bacterium]
MTKKAFERISTGVFLLILIVLNANAQTKAKTGFGLPVDKSEFQVFIDGLSTKVQGRIGMSALLIETGETVGYKADERFPMQSVYKFPIGMAALYAVDQGILKLDKSVKVANEEYVSAAQHSPLRDGNPDGAMVTVKELLRLAVSESDGTASDVLMRLVGGAQSVMNYLQAIGITGVIVKNTEKELGATNSVQYDNWATPIQATLLLKQFQLGKGLSVSSRALLMQLMTDTQTGLQRLKGNLPPGTVVAHKTGTSGTREGITAATNDIGIITLPNGRHIAIAVFVTDAKADQTTREGAIAQIARKVWEKYQL